MTIPYGLSSRLTLLEAQSLSRAVDAIGEELANVYAANVRDHRESRGDNSQLFGMKVWVHGHFRLQQRFDDEQDVHVVDANGSYSVKVGPLVIGVYKLGDFVDDDIHEAFPDASPTKRAYGERNRAQLPLFEYSPESPLPPEARYALNDLIVGHFGNPRDGLAKWYLGAFVVDETGRARWAWIERQDLREQTPGSDRSRPPIVPFDAREPDSFEVRPRRTSVAKAE